MARKYHDLLVFNEECVEFGEKELGYEKVHMQDINYIEKQLKTNTNKVNIAKGGDLKRNRAAVNKKNIDVLLDPVEPKQRDFDTALATVATQKKVTIAISLNKLLKYQGMEKVQYLRSLDYLGKILRKEGCNIVVVSGATEKLEMRPPQQLATIGTLLGIKEDQLRDTVSINVEKILRRK